MTIDRALSGDPFKIDQFRCRAAAETLKGFVPTEHLEPWSCLPTISQFVFKSVFVSICQQFNWDYLQTVMATWLLPAPETLLEELALTRPSKIASLLSGYTKPQRIRAKERARMLRESARWLKVMLDDGSLQHLIDTKRLEGPDGFYSLMKRIPAFAEDELEKKLRVLAHDLFREKIIVFQDPSNLKPAVEYHILRIYLRSGRVYTANASVREALKTRGQTSRGRLVRLLRAAVEEAMNLTAFYSGIDVASLNYIEWNMGRSICTPDLPANCSQPPHDELPGDVGMLCATRCAYADFCRSYTEAEYGWFHEPQFQKAIY